MPAKGAMRVIVLGGGPAGLGAAYLLAKRGIEVALLEQHDRVGGNAGSFELAGMPVDFGSHRLHPAAEPETLQLLQGLLGEDLLLRPRHGRIRLSGRWLHFPLKAPDLLLHAPPAFAVGVARDMLLTPVRSGTARAENFEQVLGNGLGATICENFYFPYARKIWGMEPAEISATQAHKRISTGSIGKIIGRLLPRPAGMAAQPLKGKFYYPREGFGQISEALHQAAGLQGADVRLGARVTGLEFGAAGHRVEYESQDRKHQLEAAHVWSTIPITVLVRLARPASPEPVLDAARSLRFRAMLLIYLVLETQQFTTYDAHYFPGTEIRITRLSEPKNYSARSKPRGLTVLCAELPCQVEDAVWDESAASLGALVMEDLERAGIPVRCPVRDVEVRRLPQAYPLYPVGFEPAFETLDEWVGELPNVLTFGRQGLYAHDNTHHALHMAQVAVSCLDGAGRFDRAAWARAREVFSRHVVED